MGRSGLWDWMPDISNRGTGDIVWDIFQLGAGAYLLDIEYDERIYQSAVVNQEMAVSGTRTRFELAKAENYVVPQEVKHCYFFNPFEYNDLFDENDKRERIMIFRIGDEVAY